MLKFEVCAFKTQYEREGEAVVTEKHVFVASTNFQPRTTLETMKTLKTQRKKVQAPSHSHNSKHRKSNKQASNSNTTNNNTIISQHDEAQQLLHQFEKDHFQISQREMDSIVNETNAEKQQWLPITRPKAL
jgi:hypothetical protein